MDPMLRANLHAYAFSFVGKPYHYSGDDPIGGFDCSGYVNELLLAAGVLPYGTRLSSQGLFDYLVNHRGKLAIQLDFGAIAFFGKSKTEIDHVAFGISNKTMLEAGGGTSQTTTNEKASEMNAFVKMRPMSYRKNLVALVLPAY